ncbi:set domain-containing protein 5 [Phlyctema vagabunda]|uniref:Set domain-containing protein 5 n=1 Tax=Phlyctema vagabunda TaxID=108571 RepID=A0ABR4PFM6_9HELO
MAYDKKVNEEAIEQSPNPAAAASSSITEQSRKRERKRKFEDDSLISQQIKGKEANPAYHRAIQAGEVAVTSHPSMSNPSEDEDKRDPLRVPETLGVLIEVHRSEGKGYGVFALKDIPAGSQVLCEAPLVRLIDDGARVDPLDLAVNGLSAPRKKVYQALHSYRRHKSESLNRSIMYSNGFAIGTVATGIFETASRINHSCVPNTEFAWHESLGRMVYTNRFALFEGEEITIDYGHKKGYLKKYYGFECDCGGCTEWGSTAGSVSVASSSDDGEAKEKLELPNIDALVIGEDAVKAEETVTVESVAEEKAPTETEVISEQKATED